MRLVALVAIAWTILVAVVLLATPSLVSAPPCAGLVQPLPGCAVLEDAGNQLVWVTQQRPMVVLAAGGYVAIAVLGLALRRRP
jgi:hypothetical protein